MINARTNRRVVVDADGHLTEIPRDKLRPHDGDPNFTGPLDHAPLKEGWRDATEADVAHARAVEAARAAQEAKEAEAAAKAVKAAQDALDASPASGGGPLRTPPPAPMPGLPPPRKRGEKHDAE